MGLPISQLQQDKCGKLTSNEKRDSDLSTKTTAVDCWPGVGNDAKAAQDHDESSGTSSSQHCEQ